MKTYRVPGTTYRVSRRFRAEPRGQATASRLCRYVVRGTWYLLFAATSPFSFLHSPLLAQGLTDSEIPTPLSERALPLRFEHLDINNGLTQNAVHGILQDHHGFMWFATQDGLNRYDGYEVKQYINTPFDSTTITGDTWLLGLAEDAQGYIWVTTLGDGVNRLDPVSGKVERMHHDPSDSGTISDDFALSVKVDRSDQVWTAGRGGLCRYDGGKRFTCFRHDPDDATSLNSDTTRTVYEDLSGRLWVSTSRGLALMDEGRAGQFSRYLSGLDLTDILERPQEPGILWLGSFDGYITRFVTATGKFDRYLISKGTWITALAQDPVNPNVLWVSTYGGGFGRFDLRSKAFQKYEPDPGDPNALTNDLIWDVFTDRAGIVWVGTRGDGVVRFNPSTVGFGHVRHDPSDNNSLFAESVWRVVQERDGSLWVTVRTDQGEFTVSHIDRANNSYRHFFGEPNAPEIVYLIDRQGNVWGASSDDGLGVYSYVKRAFEYSYKYDPNDSTTIASNRISDIHEDGTGTLWLATERAFTRLDPATGQVKRFKWDKDDPTKLSGQPFFISEDQTGSLWLATWTEGLNRFDTVTERVTRYMHDPADTTTISSDAVMSMIERKHEPGIIWVGTSGAGLSRLDVSTGTFTHYGVEDGLPNNVVYDILEDERGRLWMSTNRGLSRFDPETETFRNYGLETGVQALEFNWGAAQKGPFGEMFFGGINGLNAFFPNELSENSKPPALSIVDLKLSNQSIQETHAVGLDGPIEEISEIRLDYDQKDLRIDYIALHYEHPELTEFAYMLEGFNDEWVSAGTDRSASYTNLAPGEYTFRVKAANSDGVWNEEGISLRIIVEPPLWATWWFRLLAFLVIGGVLYGGYRTRVEQIASRARELEGEVEKRTSELKASNTQLEQSHTIVEAINQETSFRRLLTKILEEARVIPGIEKATAVVYMQEDDRFHVRASSGWDVQAMQDIRLTRREARDRYVMQAEEVAEDIFVAKNVAEREGSAQMAEFGQVASFLALRVRVEDEIVAYLVFDNLHDKDAFDQRDADLLERLREHIASAFIKTRILEELQTERTNLQSALDDLRSTQDRLIQSEKMASLGQLSAGIAHEIRNPLNFVNNFSDVTRELASDMAAEVMKRRDELPDDLAEELDNVFDSLKLNAEKIHEHGLRAEGIVQNMLEHSKAGEGQRTPVAINTLLDEYVTLAMHGFKAKEPDFDIQIDREYDEDVGHVDILPQEMGRVFMNLLGNAFDALRAENGEWRGENGELPAITVSTSKSDGPDFAGVEIRISDNGPGIPEKVKARIFEPFFTTKPTGSGTGLGLSMSYDIVTKGHGGSLEVESVEGEGATFIVRLPA